MSQLGSRINEPTTYKWRIANFSTQAARGMERLRSDDFILEGSDVRCWLEFRPTGTSKKFFGSYQYFSSVIVGSYSFSQGLAETLDFSFSIENTLGGRLQHPSLNVERLADTRLICKEFVDHKLIYSPGDFFTNNTVCILCEIRPKQIVVEEKEQPPVHHYDFHEKLASLQSQGVAGMCTIHVGEKTFTVDKIFLIAHSQVFERMLTSNMKEAKTGKIDITDVREETMEQFVHYLYALRVKNMKQYAEDLYVLADKYEVAGLKEECAQHLIKTLNRDNIISRFFLAFIHGHAKLQDAVLDYFTTPNSNFDFLAILASEEWEQFYGKDPKLANEVLKAVHSKARLTRET